jgi:DNA-binding XRE family transcriptional regulator
MPFLNKCFRRTVYGLAENFLPLEELAEVLVDERKADLVIGGIVDHESEIITLWRGSLEPLPVPFSAFTPSGDGVPPDFGKFRVIDYGQTIQLGPYEAATEALLYEFDPDYRRRIKKERRESEQSFGAALRRLRKQHGLRREDFAPLSNKTIARIERGEVSPEELHGRTWEILSQKLGVKAEEIETF